MRILTLISIVFALVANAYSQEYKEGLVYGVKGNVKDLKLETKIKFANKHVKFQPNGKCKKSVMYFNEDGYPLGWEAYSGTKGMSQKINYDGADRIESIVIDSSFSGLQTHNYSYSSDGTISEETIEISKNGKQSVGIKCYYTNYQFDDQGNWISRDVEQKEKRAGEDKITTYTEKRKIIYY